LQIHGLSIDGLLIELSIAPFNPQSTIGNPFNRNSAIHSRQSRASAPTAARNGLMPAARARWRGLAAAARWGGGGAGAGRT
jgi:hypothetical protein